MSQSEEKANRLSDWMHAFLLAKEKLPYPAQVHPAAGVTRELAGPGPSAGLSSFRPWPSVRSSRLLSEWGYRWRCDLLGLLAWGRQLSRPDLTMLLQHTAHSLLAVRQGLGAGTRSRD